MNPKFTGYLCPVPPACTTKNHPTLRLTLISLIFLLGSTSTLFAAAVSKQELSDLTISIEAHQESLKNVLKKIEKKAGLLFVIPLDEVETYRDISLPKASRSVKEVLDLLLHDTELSYRQIDDKTVLIFVTRKKKKKVSENSYIPSNVLNENQETVASIITGTVRDEKNEPLPGVSVVVKGTQRGSVTGLEGKFELPVDDESSILIFSFVGYQSQEVIVGNQTNFPIVLKADIKALNEVVVVGYSSQKKGDITGSVAIIDTRALQSVPTGSAAQALQAQAAGVNVVSSGMPGGRTDIFVRGVSSFGNTQPLIIIDGVQSSLDDINMNDIESMQVLKDAGAASIYGVRGSNGVVVVTTKKGVSGQPRLTYDTYFGIQQPPKGNVFNLLNSPDYADLYKKVVPGTVLFANGLPDFTFAGPGLAGVGMAGDPAVDPSKYRFDPASPESHYLIQRINKTGTDWFHEVFKNAPMQNHNLTASGGTDKAKYLLSLGYINQQGTLIETYLKRYSARVNTQFDINKKFRIGENAYVYYKQNPKTNNLAESNPISLSYRTMPVIPVYDIMGNYGGTWTGTELGSVENAVAVQKRKVNDRDNTWNLTGNLFAELDIINGLTARTSLGGTIDNRYTSNFVFNTYNDRQGHMVDNSLREDAEYNQLLTWTNTLSYSKTFARHTVKVLLGSEYIKGSGRGVGGAATKFFSTDFDYLILNNGTSNITNYSKAYNNALFSLFANTEFSFRDKYLLGATIRRDGSSVFGSDKRFGIFPSVSLGWRLSEENFMKNIRFLNDLKLKGSYGVLGSQSNINAANAYTLFGSNFGNSYYDVTGSSNSTRQGFMQNSIGNPGTGWEEDIITNFGLDATLFNNKLYLNLERYKKSINGLLFPLPLPATTGAAQAPTVNIGNIENRGWDLAATYRARVNSDFNYSIGLNMTTYRNEVIKIPQPGYFDVAGSRIGNMVRNQEGHPVGSFFGYQVEGLFSDTDEVAAAPTQTDAAPGRFRYKDVNGDNAITPDDRVFFGNPNPDFTYGINLTLNYKQFDFASIFYGSQGADVINFVRYYTEFFGTSEGKGRSNVLKDAWTPENKNTSVPIAEFTSSFSTNGVFNSYYKENGSFFKLKSIVLGYTLKAHVLQKYGIGKVRVYLQAANLLTLTKYTGLDPELGGSLSGSQSSASFGIDYGNYPNNQRNFLAGLNIKF
ncbi:SusC/RagA family TonB-linked outer membrane protein [Dyadobacter bucti]|uniref:SusC/RagA family TonB-linked outer membrane protein n=1 Tax=Dyadobacter bucti TaxID=2572203 RepID=UPI0011092F9E|nr:TonB-dependent receptor [Dyadobacter bucti]